MLSKSSYQPGLSGKVLASPTASRQPRLVKARAVASEAPSSCSAAVDTLKQAVKDAPKADPQAVFQAMRTVQREKLSDEGWDKILGSDEYWQLMFTAKKEAIADNNKDASKGTGSFFPITAAQKFNLNAAPKGTLANAVYVPHVAALQFTGPYEMKGKKLTFDYTGLKLKLGPINLGPFKIGGDGSVDNKGGPFFLFFYADEDIVCAQGKGGGIAMWKKATPAEVLEKGFDI